MNSTKSCPPWCVSNDVDHAPWVDNGRTVVTHNGPTFGPFAVAGIDYGVEVGVEVWVTDLDDARLNAAEVLALARDLLEAAEWIEENR